MNEHHTHQIAVCYFAQVTSTADCWRLRLRRLRRAAAAAARTAVVNHTCCPEAALSLTRVPSRDPMYANIPVNAVRSTKSAVVVKGWGGGGYPR
jgi:hypothetical protein